MATLLVVDDSALDRYVAGELLEDHPGWSVTYAENGREALAALKHKQPDLVLTDLQMPEIDGLELVETIRRKYAGVPVILMTAHGCEDIAVTALQKGAAGYVPKRNLARDLVNTVENLLNITLPSRNQQVILESVIESELRLVLPNDVARLQPLIGHFQDLMAQMKLVDKNGLSRVATALHEALVNAIEHGNLEMCSDLRSQGERSEYERIAERRRQELPYRDRKIYVHAKVSSAEACYVIRDEGVGFDPSNLPDPTDSANLDRESGRGVFLIRTFMDEVYFNDVGNEITMIKRRR